MWRLSGQKWDDFSPEGIVTKFLDWSSELGTVSELVMPRSYFQHNVELLELHRFGDSSKDVFTDVLFLRGKVNSGISCSTEIAFVFGKERVAPMKALTIPKLELQAALLAAILRNEVQRALTLQIERTFMWTDSTTVLQWLHSREKQPVFVANRVAEILELTTADEWDLLMPGLEVCLPRFFCKRVGYEAPNYCISINGLQVIRTFPTESEAGKTGSD